MRAALLDALLQPRTFILHLHRRLFAAGRTLYPTSTISTFPIAIRAMPSSTSARVGPLASGCFKIRAGNVASNSGDLPRYFFLNLVCDQILKEGLSGDVAELSVYQAIQRRSLQRSPQSLEPGHTCSTRSRDFLIEDLQGIDGDKKREFEDVDLARVSNWSTARQPVS